MYDHMWLEWLPFNIVMCYVMKNDINLIIGIAFIVLYVVFVGTKSSVNSTLQF